MNTSPTGNGGSSLHGPRQYGISNAHTTHRIAYNIHGDSNTNIGNVSNSYNNITNLGVDEESLRIQAWLSPLEPNKRHQDVRNRRLDGVGEWVLQRSEFESWCESQDGSMNRTLLCCGGPGVGKTYISSLVIDTLQKRTYGQNIAVLSLYCDYQAHKDQSVVNMMGGLLRQVALRAATIPSEIKSAFDESKHGAGQGLRLPEMLKLFIKAIISIDAVYLCIDAVDEVLRKYRSELLRAFRQIVQDAPNVRLFLTGRPHIRGELDNHLTKGAYIVHIVADQGDIARYVSQIIENDNDLDPGLMTEDLKNDIIKAMLEKASGIFLLVALNIEAILGETSLARRKKMLQKVATTGVDLDSVYAQTPERIREQKGDRSRLGMEVLMWVSHAVRPLGISELCHALAVEMESTDLGPENIRPQDTVLGSCLGLAVVDAKTSTVRLIHYTLQEYLSWPGILPDAHKTLGQTCLTYLNHKEAKGLPAKSTSNLGDMPFLKYSSLYCGSHAKVELSGRAKLLALELLDQGGNNISTTILVERIERYHSCSLPYHLWPSLHCASYFGITEVVAALIERGGCGINHSDCIGFTPLIRAARQGNEGVMRLLLAQDDINPTSLIALVKPHFGGLLARDDINPDKPNNDSETSLWDASCNGHEGVVKLLLARNDTNPNTPGNVGLTPLFLATAFGQEGVVKLLLARDNINPNHLSIFGQTPLSYASSEGNGGVVKLLLARNDIDPNSPDNEGLTPLLCASRNGHEGVVKLLLARDDVNPDIPDHYG